jgi:hypothetical protein
MVFVSSTYQYDQEIDPNGAYVVTGTNELTFPDEHLQLGEVVSVIVGVTVTTMQPYISVKQGYYVVETDNQTLIPMPNGITNTDSESDIQVYHEQLFLTKNVHYVEHSDNTIELTSPASVGDIVHFIQGGVLSNVPEFRQESMTIPLFSSAYINRNMLSENQDKVLFIKGGTTLADGSGGMYVFDGSCPQNLANGVTVIDANQDFNNQGDGTGNGCWMRQYEGFIKPEWFNSPYQGIGALRFCKALPDDRVMVDGFYEDSAVGGGIFVWNPDMDSSNHNGGTIISPLVVAVPGEEAWYTSPASGTQGCWVKLDVDTVTTDDFGVTASNGDAAFAQMDSSDHYILLTADQYDIDDYYSSGNFYTFQGTTILGDGALVYKDLSNVQNTGGYKNLGDYDIDGPLTITKYNQIFSKGGYMYRPKDQTVLPYTTRS